MAMRYEQNGTSIWWGTHDAPAHEGEVPASSSGRANGLKLTFAVHPTGSRNAVEVRYRVNGGAVATSHASHAGSNTRTNTQYFVATLRDFVVGDSVEYVGVLIWPKGQVPPENQAATFPSSFKIVAADKMPADGATKATTPKSATHVDAHRDGNSQAKSSSDSHAGVPASSADAGARKDAMNKAQLLALARSADLTVAEIEKAEPSLGRLLADRVASQRKRTVLSDMKGCSPALMDALKKIDFSPTSPSGTTIGKAITAGLAAQKVSEPVVQEAAKKVRTLERTGRLTDEADPDTPIKRDPLFEQDLKQAALYKLTDSVK